MRIRVTGGAGFIGSPIVDTGKFISPTRSDTLSRNVFFAVCAGAAKHPKIAIKEAGKGRGITPSIRVKKTKSNSANEFATGADPCEQCRGCNALELGFAHGAIFTGGEMAEWLKALVC
jgi:hypothetical protein